MTRSPVTNPLLTYSDEEFTDAVREGVDGRAPTTTEVAEAVGCSIPTAHRRCHELAKAGRLDSHPVGDVVLWTATATTTETTAGAELFDTEALATADLQLSELVEVMECVEWSTVPGISTAEAAAWTSRLVEARDAVREADGECGGTMTCEPGDGSGPGDGREEVR
jgi:hypothetical protein